MTPDRPQALFIFGCPRSGTTYLGELLNHHSKVLMTNELRMMSFYTDMLANAQRARHQIHNQDLRDSFIAHMKAQVGPTIESYYRALGEKLHRKFLVWGDKTPGYADPDLCPGCLEFICEIFPEAKFIHIRRHPLEVIRSLVGKRWMGLDAAVDIWVRITRRGRELGRALPKTQYLEISHEKLTDEGERVAGEVLKFLGLEPEAGLTKFIRDEEQNRTPYSDPLALPGGKAEFSLSEEQVARVHELMGHDLNDVEGILSTYSRKTESQSSTKVSRVQAGGIESVAPESLLGELEARITGVGLAINGEAAASGAEVHVGDKVTISVRAAALRPFAAVILGVTAFDAQDRAVMGGNNALSGISAFELPAGISNLTLTFAWPDLGNGTYRLTPGIGEGTDGEHNVVQCWADKALTLTQGSPRRAGNETVRCVVLDAHREQN